GIDDNLSTTNRPWRGRAVSTSRPYTRAVCRVAVDGRAHWDGSTAGYNLPGGPCVAGTSPGRPSSATPDVARAPRPHRRCPAPGPRDILQRRVLPLLTGSLRLHIVLGRLLPAQRRDGLVDGRGRCIRSPVREHPGRARLLPGGEGKRCDDRDRLANGPSHFG